MADKSILQEITPLEEHDFMYVADRHKAGYDYPLHRHELFELNFVEHGAGCERIVGDSVETIEDYELVLTLQTWSIIGRKGIAIALIFMKLRFSSLWIFKTVSFLIPIRCVRSSRC